MSRKKDLPVIFAVFSLVMFFILILFAFLSSATKPMGGITETEISGFISMGIVIILGTCFVFTDTNKVLKKIGFSLLGLIGIILFSTAITIMIKSGQQNPNMGNPYKLEFVDFYGLVFSIVLLAGPIIYFISEILNYFGFTRTSTLSSHSNNDRITNLKKWNKLVEQNIITNDDYQNIKKLILQLEIDDEKIMQLVEVRELLSAKLADVNDLNNILNN